ncbi:MAG: helix-turn-helix domain-containing protein [Fusobacterium ulcerans]|uniref:helix-turn-helix domain-containing protein n=1 Tax=Fusobacterium ulcerans TaxID=861 RepID=UPI003A8613A6
MNNLIVEYKNMIAFHPGYYIKELIEEEELTQQEFAKKIGTTPKTISKLLNGEINLSDEVAIGLAIMYKTSVEVWKNLQRKYEDVMNEIKKNEDIKKQIVVLEYIDYNFFVEQKLVEPAKTKKEKIENLCSYFNVASLKSFDRIDYFTSYRKENTKIYEKNIINSNLWVQTAINEGVKLNISQHFDKEKLLKSIPEIRKMTLQSPKVFYPRLKEIFKECGVSFILLPHLKNSKINGAVKWINKEKVILAINVRRKFADIFWFSLFHEIKHVLQKKIAMTILSDGYTEETLQNLDKTLENEADEFSKNTLISKEEYEDFVLKSDFSKDSICRFAKSINIHSGIVVGRLQKENIIGYDKYNDLREKYILE